MGLFKRATDTSFRIDSQGNTIYYPWRSFGTGFILPNKEVEQGIRRFLQWFDIINLLLIITVGAFLNLWVAIILFQLPISAFVWFVQVSRYTKGLEKSEFKYDWTMNIKKLFSNTDS